MSVPVPVVVTDPTPVPFLVTVLIPIQFLVKVLIVVPVAIPDQLQLWFYF